MKHKKIIISILIIIVLAAIGGSIYWYLTAQDKNSTLTVLEKQWIENNKNKIIDISVINEIPVLNYNGEGIFFDFLNDLEEDTGLDFNKISYTKEEEAKTNYAFKMVDKVSGNQIAIYQDNDVLVTHDSKNYGTLENIQNITIGVLNSNVENVKKYLVQNNKTITLKTYETMDELLNAYQPKVEGTENNTNTVPPTPAVEAMVLPKTVYLKNIIGGDMHIAYNITEITHDYVLTLGDNGKLNDILTKYYKKWYQENYEESYRKHLSNNYFTLKNVDEKEKVKFRSKRYSYGFVENSPYDEVINNKLMGINNQFMSLFAKLANIEISYKKFNTIEEMVTAFNENKIDFFFHNNSDTTYQMDTKTTISPFSEKVAIVTHVSNDVLINSFNSLTGVEVMAVKDTKIAEYLSSYNVSLKLYPNTKELLENVKKTSVLALDMDTYQYYLRSSLNKFKVEYSAPLNGDYNYLVRDIKDNQVFTQFLSFYLSFVPQQTVLKNGYEELIMVSQAPTIMRNVGIAAIAVIVLGGIIFLISWFNPKARKKRSNVLTKEDKLRYIDMLTSLKNRNYLNDHIEVWDASDVYPQTIIIIDLNNVAYINDNYGHAEGDKVIKEASNILIKNQIANSDIIRTNGNEFLIYMVSYDEKQVVSYMRKLTKELKELAHGFGAAIGYSMIHDAIKTIDDAVNEATLDMRNNKEELNN